MTKPFMDVSHPREFVPGVGVLFRPNEEVRATNRLDYWAVARVNSMGFLEREPPRGPVPGCPVAIIGDSFVEARQVPIADKLQVRLEEMAAAQLPHLDITAAAFGRADTGQVEQLPYYDHYARQLRPRLVALVFVENDVWNNHPVLRGIRSGRDPQHLPSFSVARRPDGTLALRPPDPKYWQFNLPQLAPPPKSWLYRVLNEASEISWFAEWLKRKKGKSIPAHYWKTAFSERAAMLSQRPLYASILESDAVMFKKLEQDIADQLAGGDLLPIYAEALEYTAFALAQFRERAARDSARLVLLASHNLKVGGNTAVFDWLQETAAAQGIPFIDQSDYILRQGAGLADAQWRHNFHWNPQGHEWAAGALLEWIRENQDVCRPEPAAGGQPFK